MIKQETNKTIINKNFDKDLINEILIFIYINFDSLNLVYCKEFF